MLWAIVLLAIFNVFLIRFAIYVVWPPKVNPPKNVTYTDKSWTL